MTTTIKADKPMSRQKFFGIHTMAWNEYKSKYNDIAGLYIDNSPTKNGMGKWCFQVQGFTDQMIFNLFSKCDRLRHIRGHMWIIIQP